MDRRFELFMKMIDSFDQGCDYVNAYDAETHQYGDEVLYQSEMHLLKAVGVSSEVTITELASKMGKTKSALSQMVHKLRGKGLLEQYRNPDNLREFRLVLTERGWNIYNLHTRFENNCLKRTCQYLDDFSDEDLQTYIRVQNKLNEAFKQDVEDNHELYEKMIDWK